MRGTTLKLNTRLPFVNDKMLYSPDFLQYLNLSLSLSLLAGDFVETERIQSRIRDQTVQSSQKSESRRDFDRNGSRSLDAEARDRWERLHQRYMDRW